MKEIDMQRIIVWGILLSGCIFVSSCSSPADRARAQAQYQAQQEAKAHSYCSGSLGLDRGTTAYADCRLKIEQMRQDRAARNAAARQRGGKALIDLGNKISKCGISGQYC